MNELIHKDLAAGRWAKLTLAEQMGNIGSEIGRAIAAKERGDKAREERALERAFELMDLTIGNHRRDPGLKELTRVREVVADYFFGDDIYGSTTNNLNKYFTEFAMSARLDK